MLLIALEVLLLSINLIAVILSIMFNDIFSQVIFLIILTIAASESAVGLSILLFIFV